MLNLNQVETGNEQKPLEIIPDRTIARGIINLLGGDTEVPEFGQGNLFKSQCRLALCIARWSSPSLVVSMIRGGFGITFLSTAIRWILTAYQLRETLA